MADATSSVSTLEVLQTVTSQSSTRRLRPPEIATTAAPDEVRVPLRPEKLGRRESRLGLRSLFGRNKASAQDVRASIANLGNLPYSFAARSESNLSTDARQKSAASVKSPTTPGSTTSLPRPTFQTRAKQSAAPPTPKPKKHQVSPKSDTSPSARSVRGSLAAWDPPPLFQAYPQAIKHAQLPACTTPIETLMRFQSHRGSTSSSAVSRESTPTEAVEDSAAAEKAKKRHRRNVSATLDWSSKIYVFVTSGYLLQYASEGSFDRLPEKMLHIGKDSAAFASDLIPGRHWVLQVCSSMDPTGPPASDSRSLFSRLPFRTGERRHASTFLMVFENADDMENWISTLRREIEHLGGKKHLSETGKPKANDCVLEIKGQPSQRTLVVRDPERFSRLISPHELGPTPWSPDAVPDTQETDSPVPDVHVEAPDVPRLRRDTDPSSDDQSLTNSMVSQDGRQLDSLRDSANRLSFISSGQRTVVTSECSSPPCSPICNSFSSNDEPSSSTNSSKETLAIKPSATHSALAEFRFPMPATGRPVMLLPRPRTTGALDNLEKKKMTKSPSRPSLPLLQTQNMQIQTISLAASPITARRSRSPSVPNFSVPHKRSSVSPSDVPLPPPTSKPVSRPSIRRAPPPSLVLSRPLSVVPDQPSPGHNAIASGTNVSSPSYSDVPDTPSLFAPVEVTVSSERDTLVSAEVRVTVQPRAAVTKITLPTRGTMPALSIFPVREIADRNVRSSSAMGSYRQSRSQSPSVHVAKQVHYKRASMFAQPSEVIPSPSVSFPSKKADDAASRLAATRDRFLERREQQGPRSSVSTAHLRARSSPPKSLAHRRRSLSQLAEGPPPAPPPTCALPPLPPNFCTLRGRPPC